VTTTAADADHDDLAEFGYKQELDRSIGKFASFAAGVSYISILTGTFQLFFFGFATGGPAYWWSWPMVFVGQLMIALCFAELAAAYPVAGSVYNWSKRLGSATVAWLAGWMMLTASIVTIAAVALANQYALPQIWSAFQFIGDGTGKYDFSINAVILGTALIVFTTLVNAWGVKLMARINSTGVFIELIAAVLLIILLAVNIKRGPGALFDNQGKGAGHDWGYFGAFLVASLASAYVMYGFDTASSLGEETIDPRRTAPKAILRAVNASFLLGGAILLFAILAANDLTDQQIASGGMQFIVLDVLGTTVGKAILICAAIAIWVCGLAVQTATIRMIFAMARDNNLPAGSVLAKVHPKYKTPVVPAVITGIIAVLILLVNIRQPQIFTVITSIGIIMIYVAYLLVTGPMLVSRLRGRWPPPGVRARGYFSLGRLGLPINVLAVAWGALMALNLAWPRGEVYNATAPFHWYLRWGAFLFIGIVMLGGLAYYLLVQRHKTGVLAEHAAAAPEPVAPAPAPGPAIAGGAE
jgi:urea carboxylase system permease